MCGGPLRVSMSCRVLQSNLLQLYYFSLTAPLLHSPFSAASGSECNFYTQPAHLFCGWQLSLISWGFCWTTHRKGVYFLWLLVVGRHLVVFRSGYLELAYLVWLQCRFELWTPGGAVLLDGKTNRNRVWPSSNLCLFRTLAASRAVFSSESSKENLPEVCLMKKKITHLSPESVAILVWFDAALSALCLQVFISELDGLSSQFWSRSWVQVRMDLALDTDNNESDGKQLNELKAFPLLTAPGSDALLLLRPE